MQDAVAGRMRAGATIDIHRALVAGAGQAEVAHVLGVSVAEVAAGGVPGLRASGACGTCGPAWGWAGRSTSGSRLSWRVPAVTPPASSPDAHARAETCK